MAGIHARATYPYETPNSDELSFAEGDVLSILDRSEQDWWKTEKDGVVLSVPASYLEVVDG
jgi:actin cytoskeleton-regulatory complex protein PAN1